MKYRWGGVRYYGATVGKKPTSDFGAVSGVRWNVLHSNVPLISVASIIASREYSGCFRGQGIRKNYEENSESVWSSSNFFLAKHIFIFNAAVSNNTKRA